MNTAAVIDTATATAVAAADDDDATDLLLLLLHLLLLLLAIYRLASLVVSLQVAGILRLISNRSSASTHFSGSHFLHARLDSAWG